MKVSFDFDSTLSYKEVEEYAKKLVDEGHEVWIVTSRLGEGEEPNLHWNDDLFECADRIEISREHIYFTCLKNKSEFFADKTRQFLWHLDDDLTELSFIRTDTEVFPIWRHNSNKWKLQCDDLIRIVSIWEQRIKEN